MHPARLLAKRVCPQVRSGDAVPESALGGARRAGLPGRERRPPSRVDSAPVCVSVVDNSSNWAVCGKSSGVISMPAAAQATHRVHMEVLPLFAGYLPLPDVRLFKYLPHHSAHASQLDAGEDPGAGRGRAACQRGLGAPGTWFPSPRQGDRSWAPPRESDPPGPEP